MRFLLISFSILSAVLILPTTSYAQSDESIRGEIWMRFFVTRLRPTRKDISVSDGFVTLEGTSISESAVLAAQLIVSDVPGVRGVENNLRVDPNPLDRFLGEPRYDLVEGWEDFPETSVGQFPRESADADSHSLVFRIAFALALLGVAILSVLFIVRVRHTAEEREFRAEILSEHAGGTHLDLQEYKEELDKKRKLKRKSRRWLPRLKRASNE